MLSSLKNIFTIPFAIIAYQFAAPIILCKFPSFHRLRVKQVKTGKAFDKCLNMVPPNIADKDILHISGVSSINKQYWYIDIDLDDNRIFSSSYNTLYNEDYSDGADIYLMILGLPGVILFSPIWFPIHIFHMFFYKYTGLQFKTWVLWKKLKSQLDKDSQKNLLDALLS